MYKKKLCVEFDEIEIVQCILKIENEYENSGC